MGGVMKRYLLTKWYEFKYRNIPYGVCCCGADMHPTQCLGGLYACRDSKEYAITSEVQKHSVKGGN